MAKGRIAFGLVVVAVLVYAVGSQLVGPSAPSRGKGRPAPVSIAKIETRAITLSRTYSGTLEAPDSIVLASKVEGRVEEVAVDLADVVTPGAVLVRIDDDAQRQLLSQATAELAVAKANHAEAKRAVTIASRDLERVEKLRARGVSSESQLDAVRANHISKTAQVEVTAAQIERAAAALQSARIRLNDTRLSATWEGDSKRVVAERFVDEGALVTPNQPLLSIVQLDPIEAVVFVSEKDYGRLSPDQRATLTADAFDGERFEARVARIAPVFRPQSRQARVELVVDNADGRLKPGMFIRATITLAREEATTVVPNEALTTRDGEAGVFLVNDDDTVSWRPVRTGIADASRVQILEGPTSGRVVTLGHQLLDDGSAVTIPDAAPSESSGAAAAR